MDGLVLADQQRLTYIGSVQTQDDPKKIYQEQWMIGMDSKRESKNCAVRMTVLYQSDFICSKFSSNRNLHHLTRTIVKRLLYQICSTWLKIAHFSWHMHQGMPLTLALLVKWDRAIWKSRLAHYYWQRSNQETTYRNKGMIPILFLKC